MIGFFTTRPIFASAIAIIMMMAGAICYFLLPVSQFPDITPPQVVVSAMYPGASAQVVADTVTTPLEQQINGVAGMTYMSSTSANDGSATITITFDVGYNLAIAAVDVQNRVSQASAQLPGIVNQGGVTIKKQNPNFVLIVNLTSPDRSIDSIALSNYAYLQLVDPIKRLPGVGDVQIFGERRYSMRIWLDPDKLADLGVTAVDVQAALAEQNIQVAAARSGSRRRPLGPRSKCRLMRSADSAIPSNSATSSCAPILPEAPWCGCATWRGSSLAPCNIRHRPFSAMSRPSCSAFTRCPDRTRLHCNKAFRTK